MIRPEDYKQRASAFGHLMVGAERWFSTTKVEELSKSDQELWAKFLSGKALTEKQEESKGAIKKRLETAVEPSLSEGAKTHLQNVFYGAFFDFDKSMNTKATMKGNIVEELAIKQFGALIGYTLALKNQKHFQNDHSEGTPDYLPPINPNVFDVKAAWEPSGLKVFEKKNDKRSEDINRLYTWQVKDYCWLTGRSAGAIVRILMSLPESLLLSTAKSYWVDAGGSYSDIIPDSFIDDVREMFDFEKKAKIEDRISITYIDFDPVMDVRKMIAAVKLAREYLEELCMRFSRKNIEELRILSRENITIK